VPTAWDETRLVDGYPGRFVIMARRSGNTWYIAAINGTGAEKQVTPDLSFLPEDVAGALITDGPDRTFIQTKLESDTLQKPTLTLPPNGGFVMIAK
jgi:hypothetical protein